MKFLVGVCCFPWIPAGPRYTAVIFHQEMLVLALEEHMQNYSYNVLVHRQLVAICEQYKVVDDLDPASDANFIDLGNDAHLVALQNEVGNTEKTNPQNHGGPLGQKRPKSEKKSCGGDRVRVALESAPGNSAKTLKPQLPPYLPSPGLDPWLLTLGTLY